MRVFYGSSSSVIVPTQSVTARDDARRPYGISVGLHGVCKQVKQALRGCGEPGGRALLLLRGSGQSQLLKQHNNTLHFIDCPLGASMAFFAFFDLLREFRYTTRGQMTHAHQIQHNAATDVGRAKGTRAQGCFATIADTFDPSAGSPGCRT